MLRFFEPHLTLDLLADVAQRLARFAFKPCELNFTLRRSVAACRNFRICPRAAR